MGICYDLVSDATGESFDLGKSFWGICWSDFQFSPIFCKKCDGTGVFPPTPGFGVPCTDCIRGKIGESRICPASYQELIEFFQSKLDSEHRYSSYIADILLDIWKFMVSHPDWKCVSDAGDDYSTFDSKEELEEDRLKWPDKDKYDEWKRYVEVGTRYEK